MNEKKPLMPAYDGTEEYGSKKKALIIGGFLGAASLLTVANISLDKTQNIYTLREWNRAFKDKTLADQYVRDSHTGYQTVQVEGTPYYYITSAGNINTLNNSGQKQDPNLFVKTQAELKEKFFNDLNQSTKVRGPEKHNSHGEVYWTPLTYNEGQRGKVWESNTNENKINSLYGGPTLTKYYLGADGTTPTNSKTYTSLGAAIDSLVETTGVTYSYDGQLFNTLTEVYNHFITNHLTISDIDYFKQKTQYNTTNGNNILSRLLFDTLPEAISSVKSSAKQYERTLVSAYNWTSNEWETSTNYETNKDTWIKNHTTAEVGEKWIDWATKTTMNSFMGTKRYMDGISDYSWNFRSVWTGSSTDSTIWRGFRASKALGQKLFNSEYTTTATPASAYTCTGDTVTSDTQFIRDFKLLWNEFGLQRARDYDTEVKAKLCEGGIPIYAEKGSASTRGWRDDFWFSNWLTDRLDTIVAPAGTPAYTPTEDDYRLSAEYTSSYNTWEAAQNNLNNKVWNGTKYNNITDAFAAIDTRINSMVDATIFEDVIYKKGSFSYPGEATTVEIINTTEQKVRELIETKFYNDKRWTVGPGGTYTLKAGVNFTGIGIDTTGAPSGVGYALMENFLKSKMSSKWGIPGWASSSYGSIIAYDHNEDNRVVVYKNFNNSKKDLFHYVEEETTLFDEYVWNNLAKYNFILQDSKTASENKVVLKIDTTKTKFDTIDEAMTYWLDKMK